MIVQCPNCQTKFSIDSQLLAGVEDPRFHCSRCGHYFRQNESEACSAETDTSLLNNSPARGSATSPPSEEIDSVQSQEVQSVGIQSDVSDSTVSDSAVYDPFIGSADGDNDWIPDQQAAERELMTTETPTTEQLSLLPDESQDLSITSPANPERLSAEASSDLGFTVDWPEDSVIVEPSPSTLSAQSAPIGKSALPPSTGRLEATGIGQLGSSAVSNPTSPLSKLISELSQDAEASKASYRSTYDFRAEPEEPLPSSESVQVNNSASTTTSGGWQLEKKWSEIRSKRSEKYINSNETWTTGRTETEEPGSVGYRKLAAKHPAFVISLFPALFAMMLYVVSRDLDAVPSRLASILHMNASHLPKLPPSGVEVSNLNSKVVHLLDGNKVIEVTGEVMNATVNAYSGVRVETVLFDRTNNEIRREIVDSSTGLKDAEISNLAGSSINALQKTENLEGTKLEPHRKIPFRVVFTDLSGKEAWMTSRVYSLHRS